MPCSDCDKTTRVAVQGDARPARIALNKTRDSREARDIRVLVLHLARVSVEVLGPEDSQHENFMRYFRATLEEAP